MNVRSTVIVTRLAETCSSWAGSSQIVDARRSIAPRRSCWSRSWPRPSHHTQRRECVRSTQSGGPAVVADVVSSVVSALLTRNHQITSTSAAVDSSEY